MARLWTQELAPGRTPESSCKQRSESVAFGVLVLGLIARIYSQITLLLFLSQDIDRAFR